jgi:hypothetical protein
MIIILLCYLLLPVDAFPFSLVTPKGHPYYLSEFYHRNSCQDFRSTSSVSTIILQMAGGWGKRKKELTPEESARGDGVSGERRGFDAYELQVRP